MHMEHEINLYVTQTIQRITGFPEFNRKTSTPINGRAAAETRANIDIAYIEVIFRMNGH